MRHRLILATLGVALGVATPSAAQEPQPGRITGVAGTVSVCPLLSWATGGDSGCDRISKGTAVLIHECGISPETRYGPFCRIEYEVNGVRKIQLLPDVGTATPLDADDPTFWEILEWMR